jgi:hypothetical protein
VYGDGNDIWGTADNFHFLYATIDAAAGFTIEATVDMQPPIHNAWAKGGLMVRANNTAGSPFVLVAACNTGPGMGGDHDLCFQWRDDQDGAAAWGDDIVANNGSVRLVLNRQAGGTAVAAGYDDLEGIQVALWTSHDAPNIPQTGTILVGLAFTSHAMGLVSSAVFSDVVLSGPVVVPQAPTNLTALVIGPGEVQLNWQDNSAAETGFAVERREGAGGTYAEIGTVGANVTSYIDSGVPDGVYYYRV